MKRTFSLIGMAAMVLLLSVSCKKEEKNGMKTVRFDAGIEQDGGKHYINNLYEQYWTLGDMIKVNGIDLEAIFVDNPDLHQGFSVFEGTMPEDQEFKAPYYAVYPSTSRMYTYEGTGETGWETGQHCIDVEFKDVQTYVSGTFDPTAAPMAAVAQENKINFQTMYSLLQFSLYSGEGKALSISKLVLNSKPLGSNPAIIAGKAAYNQDSGENKPDESTLKTSITLNCTNPVEIPASIDGKVPFYFVIAPCKMGGFTLEVYTSDDESAPYVTINSDNSVTVVQNAGNLVYYNVPVKK